MVNSQIHSDKAKNSELNRDDEQLSHEGISIDELSSTDFSYDKSALGMTEGTSNTNTIQKKGGDSTEQESQMLEEEELLQMKGGEDKDEDKSLQFKVGDSRQTTGGKSAVGTFLPTALQAKMENSFGADFSNVKIHTDSAKASQVRALAYTQGNEIHFAPGQYQPGSKQGQELLGHELTHVVQQRNGKVKPTTKAAGQAVNDSPELEKEADEMGIKAANGISIPSKGKHEHQSTVDTLQFKEGDFSVLTQQSGREISCNKSNSVKTGTQLTYTLEQLSSELWPADSKFSYYWKVENSFGTSFIDKVTSTPTLNCSAVNPGDYKISVQVLNNGSAVPGMLYNYNQNVFMQEKNTELGGLSVGNFDFKFDGSKIDVSVRVKFDFEDTIPEGEHVPFKNKFFNAIRTTWGSNARKLEGTTDKGVKFDIPINIKATEVSDNSYHKVVEVTKDRRRPKVIDEINVYLAISENTIAHEFGHVLGLDDEYDGGWVENIMFWHDDGSNQSDTAALMNDGTELRDRYYQLYKNAVESTAAEGYSYKIK